MNSIDAAGLRIGDDHPPRIMGVVNLSPASGYAPNTYDPDADLGAAVRFVDEELADEGADIVDVGLQSANPASDVLDPETELERLDAAVALCERCEADPVFGIETRYAAVADAALSGGFDLVNDVCGFADPDMRSVCEAHDAAVVKMASPPDLERPGDLRSVDAAFEALERGGLTEKTILDPAFGGWSDAKTTADDRERFRRLREFRAFDRPVLTATNREAFLGEVTGADAGERLPESLAAATLAVARGAHVLRTHDVAETRRVARVAHELREPQAFEQGPPRVAELRAPTARELRRHVGRRGGDPTAVAPAVAHSFVIDSLDDADRERLVAAAERAGVVAVLGPESTFLGGSDDQLSALLDDLGDVSDGLAALAGGVRRALTRSGHDDE